MSRTVIKKTTSKSTLKATSKVTSKSISKTTSNTKSTPLKVSEFQEKVYALLLQIPSGKISTYAHLATALSTSPRAVGNALRHNPFAPEVPCHRVITSSGFIGGFMGECNAAPSGVNQMKKRELLAGEGVVFDEEGKLVSEEAWFDGPWDLSEKAIRTRMKHETNNWFPR